MNKGEIIERLEKFAYWEDEFILKYDDESIWILLETLPKGKFEQIKKLLKENIMESKGHERAIKSIVEELKEGKK